MKRLFSIILVLIIIASFISCSNNEDKDNDDSYKSVTLEKNDEEMFTDRDLSSYEKTDETKEILLSDDKISTQGSGISVNNSVVTISEGGIYYVSGSLNDGMIIVDSPNTEKIQLVLNNVSIKSESSSPIYIKSCNKTFITINGTESKLSNGGTYTQIDENNIDGVIFSKEDLTVNGSGSLTIEASVGNGIACKDDLVVANLSLDINCGNHGLDANNSVRIKDASIKIASQNDGIHAEHSENEELGYIYISSGQIEISSLGDGFDASSNIQIVNGNIKIEASQNETGNSNKGIKADGCIQIENGEITVISQDDSIHSNTQVNILGGKINLTTNDDGVHADEILNIENGEIDIIKSYEGLEAHTININGGKIVLNSTDDGINAAGGNDQSGFGGEFGGDNFQRPNRPGAPNGMGGGGMASGSSDGSVTINNGEIYINASGDGIDANGTLLITGGYTVVCGPTQGDTAVLDYDVSGIITGGTFIGTGSYMMAQTLTGENQGVYSVSTGNQQAGTRITLSDLNGNIIFDYTPNLPYAIVILTSKDIIKGESYTITVGDLSGTFEAQ